MKRHKPKDRGRSSMCDGCPMRGVQYSAGTFTDFCKVDGTRIETQPVYCPHKPKEEEQWPES